MIQRWHWLAMIAAIGLAFAGGRISAPSASVVYKDREVIKYRDRTTSTIANALTKTEGPKTKILWHERTVTEPSGVVYVDRWHERETAGPVVTKAEESTVFIREVEVDKIRDVVRIVTRAPTWSVSVLGGTSVPEPWLALPGASHAVVGVSVERHIVGPFTFGTWANTFGGAGLSIGARW